LQSFVEDKGGPTKEHEDDGQDRNAANPRHSRCPPHRSAVECEPNLSDLSRRNKSIATPRQSLDKTGTFRRIAQHLANLVYGSIQVVIEIDKRVRPKPLLQSFPSDHLTGSLQQDGENLERLAREFEFHSSLAQFSCPKVNFEGSEPD